MSDITFADIAIVACGTMSMELRALKESGFLDTEHLLFTAPGLHQDPRKLEQQLIQRIEEAKQRAEKVLDYFDWMGIPLQAYPVTFDRFKSLLSDQARVLTGR